MINLASWASLVRNTRGFLAPQLHAQLLSTRTTPSRLLLELVGPRAQCAQMTGLLFADLLRLRHYSMTHVLQGKSLSVGIAIPPRSSTT